MAGASGNVKAGKAFVEIDGVDPRPAYQAFHLVQQVAVRIGAQRGEKYFGSSHG